MNYNCNSNYTPEQNAQRCPRFYNNKTNACATKMATIDCTPWNKKNWDVAVQPTRIDPTLHNWLNSCYLCNFYTQEQENQYLCNRAFYNGEVRAPCNRPVYNVAPVNSADELKKMYSKSK